MQIFLYSPVVTNDYKTRVLNLLYGFLADDATRSAGPWFACPNTNEISTGIMASYFYSEIYSKYLILIILFQIGVDWYTSKIENTVHSVLETFLNFIPDEKSFKSLHLNWMGTEQSILKGDDNMGFGRVGEVLLRPLMTTRDKLEAYEGDIKN